MPDLPVKVMPSLLAADYGDLRAELRRCEAAGADGIHLDSVIHDFERDIVRRALEQSGGVRKKAASLLGISFRSLRYRLTKLGLD